MWTTFHYRTSERKRLAQGRDQSKSSSALSSRHRHRAGRFSGETFGSIPRFHRAVQEALLSLCSGARPSRPWAKLSGEMVESGFHRSGDSPMSVDLAVKTQKIHTL